MAYHMSFQSGPLASIEADKRLDVQSTGGFASQHFQISQYPRADDAQASYDDLQGVLAKYSDEENSKFDNNPSRRDCRLIYTSRGTEWVNYKAIPTVSTVFRAGYVYRDVFWIDCYITLNKNDFDSLSKLWQNIRQNSERLIDARLGEIEREGVKQ